MACMHRYELALHRFLPAHLPTLVHVLTACYAPEALPAVLADAPDGRHAEVAARATHSSA